MATGKRYYWMKLKDSFMTSETVDFLMSQPNGANYVVLYQMLCLKTINTEGRFERQIGAVLIPYDIEKIQRDTKWFTIDTIRVALKLYAQLGLIYTDKNGVMVIANHQDLVGSETDAAARMRNTRSRRRQGLPPGEQGDGQCANNVTPENRDKRVEKRDKSLDTREQSLDVIPSISSDDDLNDDEPVAGVIEEFAYRNGMTIDAYKLLHACDQKTRGKISEVAKTLFSKAVGTSPTEMDEAKIFTRVMDGNKVSSAKIYILTCAFYKAADAGHRGQWNYIESILDDMDAKGVKTKDDVAVYFRSRKGEY